MESSRNPAVGQETARKSSVGQMELESWLVELWMEKLSEVGDDEEQFLAEKCCILKCR